MSLTALDDLSLARLRARLLARIHRSYQTTTSAVSVGGLSLAFTRIADPDRVLDEVAEQADRRQKLAGRPEPDELLHLPYWAELWDSAMGIAQFLTRGEEDADPSTSSGQRTRGHGDAEMRFRMRVTASPRPRVTASFPFPAVLDLGCGMGLSGTVAAALGARVTFADLEPPALLFARLNSLPWRGRVRTHRLNWKTDRLNETFDLILGADILYERAQWEHLEPFWRAHLAPAGSVLLAEPGRQTGDLFLDWIIQRPWRVECFQELVPSRTKPIRLFLLRPR